MSVHLASVSPGAEQDAQTGADAAVVGSKNSTTTEQARVRAGRMLRRAAELHEVSETTIGAVLGLRQQRVSERIAGARRIGLDEILRLAEHGRTRRVAQSVVDQLSAVADSAGAPPAVTRSTLDEVVHLAQRLGDLATRVQESRCPLSEAGEEEGPDEALAIDRALAGLIGSATRLQRARMLARS